MHCLTHLKKDKPNKGPQGGCLKCGKDHWLSKCPNATEEEKVELAKKAKGTYKQPDHKVSGSEKKRMKRIKECMDNESPVILLNGKLQLPYCADSGADRSMISRHHALTLIENDPTVVIETMDVPINCMAIGHQLQIHDKIALRVMIHTAAGAVTPVEKFECLVMDVQEEEFILGKDILKAIGIDVDKQLEQLAKRQSDNDGDTSLQDDDVEVGIKTTVDETMTAINHMIQRAADRGFPLDKIGNLRKIVLEFDIWRLNLGDDPPAKVEPLEIQLKPDASPYKCKARRYPPHLKKFLREFNEQLVELGLVYENQTSRWACPAYPVKKPGSNDEYRQTSDYRPVNAMTEPIAAVMPILSVIVENVKGSKFFGTFDLLKGFWQLPLAWKSQEILSYMTDEKVYSPTRVPQGCCDAAMHFQTTMEQCFSRLLYKCLLLWIDDLLLYAKNVDTYLVSLHDLFTMMNEYGLKFSIKKTNLYQDAVTWCGKHINGDGVTHDETRINALRAMSYPVNAAELQQFLCACNWVRDSLIDYARTAQPLQDRLDKELGKGKRTKRVAAGINITLSDVEMESFDEIKTLLAHSTTLAHPNGEATICLFADASDRGWGTIVTQVVHFKDNIPIHQQQHQMLCCVGGTFKGAQLHWSVIEKEAYPILKSCEKLSYLLLRPQGFKLFCDHRNLIHIFCPSTEIKKHVKGKLLRWALKLSEYRYVIEHITGEDNVWADMVSRWAGVTPTTYHVKRVTTRNTKQTAKSKAVVRPMDSDNFVWPTLKEIRSVQKQYKDQVTVDMQLSDVGLWLIQGKIWIPTNASNLIRRLLIVAHCGPQGHRGRDSMVLTIQRVFTFVNLRQHVDKFLRRCLLCLQVKKGKIVPRPWAETMYCFTRNMVLHWDFLYMGESYGTSKYLLVLKHEASHFVELVVCDTPTSEVAASALMAWNSRYGLPGTWVSDNGTHFKNEVIKLICDKLKRNQDFTLAYSPWINGSVERVNRDILQVVRSMILEYHISTKEWVYLVPLIQAILNHTPVSSLAGKAPVEVFTGLPCPSPLQAFYVARDEGECVIDVTTNQDIDKAVETLRKSIQDIHKEVKDARERQTLLNKRKKRADVAVNFSIGDYVLRSRVDEKHVNKLLVTWTGPYVVTGTSRHAFRVKHLVTGAETDVHASRLKFYAESDLEVTQELLEHVAAQGIILDVKKILKHRLQPGAKDYELLVSWYGLESIEDSWEPMKSLGKDVRKLVDQYVNSTSDDELKNHWKGLSKAE